MTTQPTDRGEPIPESRIIKNGKRCSFCGGPLHYGFCDALREARAEAERTGRGRPVPIMASGPQPIPNPIVRPGP